MIFVKDKCYAKVWDAKPAEKYIDLRISTSEKKQDGTYVYSNWFARAIGKAKDSLAGVAKGDNIEINCCKISNESYEKDGKKLSRLEFIILDANKKDASGTAPVKKAVDIEPEEEDVPW